MAKLYAELTSDKGGRIASKGGDSIITVELYRGNIKVGRVTMDNHEVKTEIYKDKQLT
jgi:hypothetical protein